LVVRDGVIECHQIFNQNQCSDTFSAWVTVFDPTCQFRPDLISLLSATAFPQTTIYKV